MGIEKNIERVQFLIEAGSGQEWFEISAVFGVGGGGGGFMEREFRAYKNDPLSVTDIPLTEWKKVCSEDPF